MQDVMYRGNYEGVEHPSSGSFLHSNMAVLIKFSLFHSVFGYKREETDPIS